MVVLSTDKVIEYSARVLSSYNGFICWTLGNI